METKSCPFEEMSPISGYLPSNARWRSEGNARSREDEMAVPPWVLSGSSVLTLRIRFLALLVFSVLSDTFSKHCWKKSVNQRPPKLKAEFRTPIVDFLCVKVLGRVKKDRTLVKKIQIEIRGQLNTWCSGWRNKDQGSWTGILSRGNHRQSKPKEGKVEVRDLRGILVVSSRAQSQAVGRSIYIQWIPFLMFETLNSCRRKLVCAKTRECKHCGASLGRHAPFSSMETK